MKSSLCLRSTWALLARTSGKHENRPKRNFARAFPVRRKEKTVIHGLKLSKTTGPRDMTGDSTNTEAINGPRGRTPAMPALELACGP